MLQLNNRSNRLLCAVFQTGAKEKITYKYFGAIAAWGHGLCPPLSIGYKATVKDT